jgi:ribosome-associated toxin RatA of RatAB toxin-antitoxin module
MFALVTDVSSYPEFLPWCDKTRIVSQDASGMVAEIGMALGGFHKSFTTRNVHTQGRQVKLSLIDGPFKQLDGTWDFFPLAQEGSSEMQRACRVELTLHYSFESMFGALVGPLFDKIAATLIDAFVQRAEKVYV